MQVRLQKFLLRSNIRVLMWEKMRLAANSGR